MNESTKKGAHGSESKYTNNLKGLIQLDNLVLSLTSFYSVAIIFMPIAKRTRASTL